ncbi:MAG TPA: CoA transferase [Gammaproteobacteria bacterium]|nr:CoA transferase [Gammaproteobacteria bacterium]HCG70189.1 CoA transferase [Gammaproteobacteria bacterium]
MSEQALTRVRVLDFSQVLAGPFATQQLAQLGAQVIKIEQPQGGDMTRGLMSSSSDGMAPSFLSANLGKRSLTLDLKNPDAKTIIEKLVAQCDVVVENFKPGTIERLGFGYQALKAIKPDLIYASISGFGQTGPRAGLPAFDGAIQAYSGMMSISGHAKTGPVRSGYFTVDMSTALNAAFAITAALLRRANTGEGQRIDVSMLDTAMFMQAPQVTGYLVTGKVPELNGNASPTKQPTSNVFASSNGYVQIIAMKETQVEALLTELGLGECYAEFNEPSLRLARREELHQLMAPRVAAATTEHWLDALDAIGVPVSAIQDLPTIALEPQLAHRGVFTELQHHEDPQTTLKVVRAAHVAEPGNPAVQGATPTLGEHTDEILGELGYGAAEINAMREKGMI